MSARTGTIQVRISPGVRVWHALLVALVASLLLGMVLSRASTTASTGTTFNPRDLATYMCTGHVPNSACELKVARENGRPAHVPPGGPEAYGE